MSETMDITMEIVQSIHDILEKHPSFKIFNMRQDIGEVTTSTHVEIQKVENDAVKGGTGPSDEW